jgi:hypothetical protein
MQALDASRAFQMTQKQSRLRRFTSAAIAMLIGTAVALLAVEMIVRIMYDEAVQPRFVIDSGHGVRMNQPNLETRHYVPTDYDIRITTNSAGMRGQREYAIERTPGTRRILILGDSFTFGYGVEDDEVVSAVLEDRLNAAGDGYRYEVPNLSVSGFGQAEELVTYREMGRPYDPDIVAIFYFENDPGNNAVANLFEINDDGTVTRTQTDYLPAVSLRTKLYAIPPIRWLFENSEAWNLVRNKLSWIVQKELLKKEGLKTFDATKNTRAKDLTRALLRQFALDIQSDDAVPMLVLIPGRRITSNVPFDNEELEAMGYVVVDGRDFLNVRDYFKVDAHWRPSGHAKAVEHMLEPVRQIYSGAEARP